MHYFLPHISHVMFCINPVLPLLVRMRNGSVTRGAWARKDHMAAAEFAKKQLEKFGWKEGE